MNEKLLLNPPEKVLAMYRAVVDLINEGSDIKARGFFAWRRTCAQFISIVDGIDWSRCLSDTAVSIYHSFCELQV